MQQFKIAARRRIILRPMKLHEVGDYCKFQYYDLASDKQVEKVVNLCEKLKDNSRWTIALQTHEGKLIGILDVEELSTGKAKASIEIPNEMMAFNYGFEAVDQFLKVCRERHYYAEVELETQSKNRIMKNYIRTRQLQGNIVAIKAV